MTYEAAQDLYFDDFPVGYRYRTGSVRLSEDEIVTFAKAHDPQPFHIDREAAQLSPYSGLIASGFQTMIVAFNLTLEQGGWAKASMGSPGMESVRWQHPVRPGDALHVEAEVVSSRLSRSKPDRGFTEVRYQVINQDKQAVMEYTATHILKRRG